MGVSSELATGKRASFDERPRRSDIVSFQNLSFSFRVRTLIWESLFGFGFGFWFGNRCLVLGLAFGLEIGVWFWVWLLFWKSVFGLEFVFLV